MGSCFSHLFPRCASSIISVLYVSIFLHFLGEPEVYYLISSPAPSAGTHLNFQKPEHQRKGISYMPRYKTEFILRFTLLVLPVQPFAVQNKISTCTQTGTAGNQVSQLKVQDWVLAQCQPHCFVVSILVWSRKNTYNLCNLPSWYRHLTSFVNVNYNYNVNLKSIVSE